MPKRAEVIPPNLRNELIMHQLLKPNTLVLRVQRQVGNKMNVAAGHGNHKNALNKTTEAYNVYLGTAPGHAGGISGSIAEWAHGASACLP